MLLELAPEWSMDIDRGPDWLFIRLCPPAEGGMSEVPLAAGILEKLDLAFCNRVVLEMDDITFLRSWMVGELVRLHKRLTTRGGMMRICGLSETNRDVLRICRLDDRFPPYRNRTDAVMGHRPPQPR
jgi:anti-anti-sigma factor